MLHIGIIHRNGHFGDQYVGFFLGVPFVIVGSDSLALINIVDTQVLLPFILAAVPFHGFAFNHTFFVIVLIIVLHRSEERRVGKECRL